MPKPTDVIIPMLERLQTDTSEMKQDFKAFGSRVGRLEESIDAFGPYITFTMGLHSQCRADIEIHAAEIAGIKRRLEALESKRGN